MKEKFFSSPASVEHKVALLEKEVAVIQATKLTEPQVRAIVHEQLVPLMATVSEMAAEQKHKTVQGLLTTSPYTGANI